MLFERQGDLQVVDLRAERDLRRLADCPAGQAAVAEVVTAGPIATKPTICSRARDAENLVGDHPPEVAGAGNQHPPQSDAGNPPALEGLRMNLRDR